MVIFMVSSVLTAPEIYFLHAISGDLEPNKGTVEMGPGERLSVLEQDHFKYDDFRVMDTVLMGHQPLWET